MLFENDKHYVEHDLVIFMIYESRKTPMIFSTNKQKF